jgi:hypothetical protein
MAIGDKAAAKGLVVYPNTQDKRLGYQNDNQRGDELADEITARTTAVATLTASKLDAAKVIIAASLPATIPGTSGRIWLQPV